MIGDVSAFLEIVNESNWFLRDQQSKVGIFSKRYSQVLINKRYDYPVLDRTTNPDGTRFYVDPNSGKPLASVTTILQATKDMKGLNEWRERVGDKKADAIRDEAAGLGTLLHTHMECHIQEIERPGGSNLVRQMAARMADVIIREGLPKVDEIWGMEVPLYFPGLFAGTTDLLGIYDGKPAIMDYKNTKKMKTKDQIEDYFCQTVAYGMCSNEVHGTEINTGVIFMVDRQLNYQTFVITEEEFDKYKTMFLVRLERYLNSMPG
jgi:hypothetical protein